MTTVTTSATLLQAVRQERPVRHKLALANQGTNIVYIGQLSDLTISNGTPLYPKRHLSISGEYLGPVYGVVASGTGDVRVWEILEI